MNAAHREASTRGSTEKFAETFYSDSSAAYECPKRAGFQIVTSMNRDSQMVPVTVPFHDVVA